MCTYFRRVTRGGEKGLGEGEEVSSAFFQKLEKSAPFLGKNALIVVICGLTFSFKIQVLKVSRRKNRKFFSVKPFFLVLYMIVYPSALISRKLPCPKKFLVTRLYLARICWRRSTNCFVYGYVFQVINEKTLCRKDFTGNFRDILIWK